MTVTNQDGSNPCTHTIAYTGTLRLNVTEQGGSLSGRGVMQGTKSGLGGTCLPAQTGAFFTGEDDGLAVSGSPSAVTFNRPATFSGGNNVTVTETLSFSGAINQGSISGTLTVTRLETGGSGPLPRVGTGTGSQQVTLQ